MKKNCYDSKKKFLCNHFTVTLKIRLGHLLFHIILFITGKKKKKEKNLFRKNITCFHLLILSLIAFNYRINPDIFRSELTLYFYHVSRFVKRSWNIHGIGYVVRRFILA